MAAKSKKVSKSKHHLEAEAVLHHLRENGLRLTQVREIVVTSLVSKASPISAQELMATLRKTGRSVNKTTVYREIQALQKSGVIRQVNLLDGQLRYEIALKDSHHHHLICTKCQRVMCVEMAHDLDEIERNLMSEHDFKVTSHVLEFFGLCNQCS